MAGRRRLSDRWATWLELAEWACDSNSSSQRLLLSHGDIAPLGQRYGPGSASADPIRRDPGRFPVRDGLTRGVRACRAGRSAK